MGPSIPEKRRSNFNRVVYLDMIKKFYHNCKISRALIGRELLFIRVYKILKEMHALSLVKPSSLYLRQTTRITSCSLLSLGVRFYL